MRTYKTWGSNTRTTGITNKLNLKASFFKNFKKNIKRLEVVKKILCRKYFDNTGKIIYQQAVVPEGFMKDIFWTQREDMMQGHPGSKKMLY